MSFMTLRRVPDWKKSLVAQTLLASVCVSSLVLMSANAAPAAAAELTRSVNVAAPPPAVWAAIGPFCAIEDWLPPVGTCTEDGKTPPTRTLVTKDGKATFVEKEVSRDDAAYTYAYSFVSTPIPVTNYVATIKVTAKGDGTSTVSWHGTYKPLPGKTKDANEALAGVYDVGLAWIKAKFAK